MSDTRTSSVLASQAQGNRLEREKFDQVVLDALRELGEATPAELAEVLPAVAFYTQVRSAAAARRGDVRGRVKRISSTIERLKRRGLVASRQAERLDPRRIVNVYRLLVEE